VPFAYYYEPSNLVVSLLAKCASCCNRDVLSNIASQFRPEHTEDDAACEEAIAWVPDLEAYCVIRGCKKDDSYGN
jgi:hypothetical protein